MGIPPSATPMSAPSPDAAGFPFATRFSLRGLIGFWEAAAEDAENSLQPVARAVLAELEAAHELTADEVDPAALEQHPALAARLFSAVFPPAHGDTQVAAIMAPFATQFCHATEAAARLQLLDLDRLPHRMSMSVEEYDHGRAMMGYWGILQRVYGVAVAYRFPLVLTLDGGEAGPARYFRVDVDSRFAEVEVEGEPPPLSEADRRRLVANPTDLGLWQELLPPERFRFSGFGVMEGVEVTDQQALSALKDDLLRKEALTSAASIDAIERRLRTLLGCPHLAVGLICLERGALDGVALYGPHPTARPIGRSLLLGPQGAPDRCAVGDSVYGRALRAERAVTISDLTELEAPTTYEQRLLDEGFRSVGVAPLRFRGAVIGLLEVASPGAGALNAFNTMKLGEVLGLFATALRRTLDEREDRMQAVIKRQCTAIHPVVEWRFREAARHLLDDTASPPSGDPSEADEVVAEMEAIPEMEPIAFAGVYPLYGLSDIRNSSTQRNQAIAEDLSEQLSLGLAVVVEAAAYRPLPILDELGYRIERYAREVAERFGGQHEAGIVDFLRRDVESLFDTVAGFGPRVPERIGAYRAALDPDLGFLYDQRRRYEGAVALLNDTLSAHLDVQEAEAQAFAPHYFEKYKTDGVDHNIYAGAALLWDGGFDALMLRNLRLWQLQAMCGARWALDAVAAARPMPLEAAHLILAHSAPLAIRFRYDEKRFDVDGAYNTRYEIVKKRIDKAVVRGSNGDRLTQPEHLAVVLSDPRARDEYRTYLDYLRAAGFVTGPVEDLELEALPGATGLTALRVRIVDEPPSLRVEQAVRRAVEG